MSETDRISDLESGPNMSLPPKKNFCRRTNELRQNAVEPHIDSSKHRERERLTAHGR